ncbi:MAG: hypothetical protein R3C02_00045 [Planctomycetaceae bacterium]
MSLMNAPLPLAASDEQEPMYDNDFEKSIDDVSHLDTRNDGGSNIVSRYLTDLAHQSAETWNRFWYTPTDPATLGLIRLLTGLMLVYTHWVWGLDFESFFGPESWVNSELVQRYQQDSYVFSLWFLVPYEYAFAVHMMCVGILGLFALGVFTRVTSILSLLIVISYSNRLPTAQYGLDQANGLLTLYLAIGPSGAAYSIDSWLRRARGMIPPRTAVGLGFDSYGPSIHANIAIRLIQIHMCVIYLFAGLGKLQGDAWWDGLAMDGILESRIPDRRHVVAIQLPMADPCDDPCHHPLGSVLLCPRLGSHPATDCAAHGCCDPRWDRPVHGDVDVRDHHDGGQHGLRALSHDPPRCSPDDDPSTSGKIPFPLKWGGGQTSPIINR